MSEIDKTRQLSEKQKYAIPLIITGKTDSEVAKEIGVARQTVNNWRNKNLEFIATLNLVRKALYNATYNRLIFLAAKATEVLREDLNCEDEKIRNSTARYIIETCYKNFEFEGGGETDPKMVLEKRRINVLKRIASID